MSLSPSALYHITPSLLKHPPALFIDPKATCVYLVYYYAPNSSLRRLSGSWRSRFSVMGPRFQLLVTLRLQHFLTLKDPDGQTFFIPSVLTTYYDCHSDPAKSTPHYPNETLARDASSLAHHRPPIKSLLCCSMQGKTLRGGLRLILNKMEVGGVQCAMRFSFFRKQKNKGRPCSGSQSVRSSWDRRYLS